MTDIGTTPRPWSWDFNRIVGPPDKRGFCVDVAVAENGPYYSEWTGCGEATLDISEADAALIVKAVNAHDDLVAALQEIAGDWTGNEKRRQIARAALAKVEAR